MNLQNLMAQLGNSTNPMQMLMGMLNPSQKQVVNQFQGKNNQEQAELIAKKCNELGITKEQFTQIVTMLNK